MESFDINKEIEDYINDNYSECEDGVLISDSNSMEVKYTDMADCARYFYAKAKEQIKQELDKRLSSLWDKLPDGNDFLTGKETIEGAAAIGQYRALESFDKFIDTLN